MELTSNALKDLLNDLNHFLSQTLRDETLSKNATSEKEALLARLASQLSPAYLDMNGTSKGRGPIEEYVNVQPHGMNKSGENECYEEFPERQLDSNSSQMEDDRGTTAVDYENICLPFSKLREEARKAGCLQRKEKLFFIERLIRYWAGIQHDMLLIYNSERDIKPSAILTLRNYNARSSPSYYTKDTKKQDCCFEIVCPGKKTHQFIARTAKDKEQWIAAINDSSQIPSEPVGENEINHIPAPLSPISSNITDNDDEYDDIRSNNPDYVDDAEIYHDIPELVRELQIEKTEPPPLPLQKRPVHNIPVQDLSNYESVYDDVEHLQSNSVYYNCLDNKNADPQTIEDKPQINLQENHEQNKEEEDIYDDIGILERIGVPKVPSNQDNTNVPSRIHNLIKRIEASRGNGPKFPVNNININNQNSDTNIPQSEEFYEPIDISDEGPVTTQSKPMVPPRTGHIRF